MSLYKLGAATAAVRFPYYHDENVPVMREAAYHLGSIKRAAVSATDPHARLLYRIGAGGSIREGMKQADIDWEKYAAEQIKKTPPKATGEVKNPLEDIVFPELHPGSNFSIAYVNMLKQYSKLRGYDPIWKLIEKGSLTPEQQEQSQLATGDHIPRTSIRDVLTLWAYWDSAWKVLEGAKPSSWTMPFTPLRYSTIWGGHNPTSRIRVLLSEKKFTLDSLYPYNTQFWGAINRIQRELSRVQGSIGKGAARMSEPSYWVEFGKLFAKRIGGLYRGGKKLGRDVGKGLKWLFENIKLLFIILVGGTAAVLLMMLLKGGGET